MVKIEICCGTACYLLGAEKLLKLDSERPESWNGRVAIEAVHCLEFCNDINMLGGAPFVRINGTEIVKKATPEKITEIVNKILATEDEAK